MTCDNCGHFGYQHKAFAPDGSVADYCTVYSCSCPGYRTGAQEQR